MVTPSAPHRPAAGWGKLLVLLVLVFAVATAAALFTAPKIATWYAALAKPAFTPPAWAFAPVWLVLYVLMAVAAWRVWTVPAEPSAVRAALALFAAQLALNALWSPVFFGLQKPVSALLVIVALTGMVAVTLRRFYLIDALAGLMLVPYLAWVLFATVLNAAIVGLNP